MDEIRGFISMCPIQRQLISEKDKKIIGKGHSEKKNRRLKFTLKKPL